ncbi:DUF4257 domain-containing protein [Bacillus timonensis]|nr:DUF4257 domain-containing protein [Bacillus timonensis]
MWWNLIVATVIGGFMGFLGHAKKQGRIEKPRFTKKFIYLGVFEEMIMGVMAALLIVVSTETESLFRVIFLSILAGYAGESVMRKFEIGKSEPAIEKESKNDVHHEEKGESRK